MRTIPAFPTPSNSYTWNLGYRRAFKWTKECRLNELYTMPEVKDHLLLEMEDSR